MELVDSNSRYGNFYPQIAMIFADFHSNLPNL